MHKLSRAWTKFRALPLIVQILIVLGLVLLVAKARAADFLITDPQSGDQMRLLDRPCTHAQTLGHLQPLWRRHFKDGRVTNSKGHIEAYFCWIEHDDQRAYLKFEDGSSYFLVWPPVQEKQPQQDTPPPPKPGTTI